MTILKRIGSNPLPLYKKPFLKPVITPTPSAKEVVVVVEVKSRR